MRSLIRWVLPVLLGLNGAFMLVAPGPWYETVPGVTGTGPFNPHFIRDIGRDFVGVYLPALIAVAIVWRGLQRKEA